MKIIILSIFILFCYANNKIVTKPSSNSFKFNGNFFWKVGKSYEFKKKELHRVIFNNYPVCIYRDLNNTLTAISDVCIHRGASLSKGKLLDNNCIQCPYHGWEYNKGIVDLIPGCPETKKNFGVPKFEIKETNDDVYICPTYDTNSKSGIKAKNYLYIPPEATDSAFVRISGKMIIKRQHSLITENVIDMMHISYVHSFGNQLSPVPYEIKYDSLNDFGGKTTFHYTAGPTSMSRILGNVNYVTVENEFHLPDTTVTRVFAGNIVKTIVTHCYPIGKNESILHYDLYRNFFVSPLFDSIFYKQMDITLKEDVSIINYIYDDYIKGFMNTRFDITQLKYREKWNKNYINQDKFNKDSQNHK